jgi:hypothetical protein
MPPVGAYSGSDIACGSEHPIKSLIAWNVVQDAPDQRIEADIDQPADAPSMGPTIVELRERPNAVQRARRDELL